MFPFAAHTHSIQWNGCWILSYSKSWLLLVVTALALLKRTVGWWIPVATARKEHCSVYFSQRIWRNRSVRLKYVLGMKVKPVGWTSLSAVHVLCAQPRLLQLSLSGMLELEWKRHLNLHLTEAGVWISYKMFGGCYGYWESGKMPQLPARWCLEENPAPLAGAGLGRCVFYFFFISHIPRASPGEVSHYEDGMKQEMGDL